MSLLCSCAGRQNPCRGAEAVSRGLADHRHSQLLDTVIDVPVVQVERVPHMPAWRRQPCSGVRFMGMKLVQGVLADGHGAAVGSDSCR